MAVTFLFSKFGAATSMRYSVVVSSGGTRPTLWPLTKIWQPSSPARNEHHWRKCAGNRVAFDGDKCTLAFSAGREDHRSDDARS